MPLLILFVSATLNAGASFTLKLVATQHTTLVSLATLKNPWLYLAMFLFGLNIIGYAFVLQKMPLSLGYPAYVGLTFVLVLALSLIFLRESLGWPQLLGIALILGGITLAVR